MSICNSCGGVIGRDCFNPQECAWITERQEQEQHRQHECNYAILEQRIEELEKRMVETLTLLTGRGPDAEI